MNMKISKQVLVVLLCCSLVQFTAQADSYGPIGQSSEQSPTPSVKQSSKELQQLVAPIALYPDALVAQILAASTYPTEIVEANRWTQSHSDLQGEKLAKEVDKQTWDPSVKALAQFPSVLENMDKNLSWTSSLGDAYANEPQDVTDAVQTLRQQARNAGHLNSSEQEKVTTQGNTIVIEPANPEVVYVPAYDPWLVYGAPIVAYPGWYPEPGIFWGGVGLSFGVGFGIGFFGGFGWGWGHWGYDWHGRRAIYDHHAFVSHSRTFDHGGFHHGDFGHGHGDFSHGHGDFSHGGFDHGGGFHGSSGFHGQSGTHSGAFSGFDHGGNARGFSSRGRSSFGGGFHGGGSHGGGGRHR
ncbi:MAG TPA: DUF3300 domain-containing protein [Candidatus Acidoferrum sp.]|nr:DUF3300 domain-containing protein [Candidatus Acidoferrum sp.]